MNAQHLEAKNKNTCNKFFFKIIIIFFFSEKKKSCLWKEGLDFLLLQGQIIIAHTGGVLVCHVTDFFHLDFPVSDQ